MPRDIREPLRIVIDTREQSPWSWEPGDAITTVSGLRAGDYALLDDTERVRGSDRLAVRFAIERKSLEDFLGTISSGWDRFLRELDAMEAFPAKVVIVEGDFASCCWSERRAPDPFGSMTKPPEHAHVALEPAFVARRVAELTMMGVSVLFCGAADLAAAMAYRVFVRRIEKNLEGTAK